ncbi:BTAD domain-containing putative transcriptional regulator [Catenulispora rubra]|uniref:BTAD domain-containing putative transcriptional regulator n=1 Tax=Catenulispora rubra TaxID=280293 RepID=UPI00189222F6|nr:BTAD domain-containing putative transcriptional regulator [Catenulispora rubra]
MRALLRIARPTLLLVVLVGIIGGLPWGLSFFYWSPVPNDVPDYADVTGWLDAAKLFPDQALIDVLVSAAWLLWALFTLQIAVQLPGVAADTARCLRTGVMMPTVENANLASRFLTGIALSFIAARGTLGVAVAATGTHASTEVGGPSVGTISVASEEAVHVVVAGDRLWDIAARYLGKAERWSEIFELNRYRVQDDGGVLTDPDLIQPGWRLVLPHGGSEVTLGRDAVPSRPAAMTTALRPRATSVVPNPTGEGGGVPSAPAISAPHSHSDDSSSVRPVVRRPVAVDLPNGGYVSLTLAAGFTAALAAARIRSRVRPRRRDPEEIVPPTPRFSAAETSLLRAADVLGFHDEDPYVDSIPVSDVERVPPALAELRAPEAVYLGIRNGRPILLETAAGNGLVLVGDGAQDAARALLLSCLTAGGFLASSVAFPVVTTDADLRALLGDELAARRVEHLTVCPTYAEAVKEANSTTADRCLLLTTSSDEPAEPPTAHVVPVYLGSPEANSVAIINAAFEISASGPAANALQGGIAYHLSLPEARDLFGHLPLAWSDPDAGTEPSAEPTASVPPAPRTPLEPTPVPPQASHAKPAASEAITINILGPVQIVCGGRDATADVRVQLTALLTYLVLYQNGVSRAVLAADLWPEDDPDKRRAHLTTALSHTRTALAGICGDKHEFFPKDRSVGVAYLNPEYFDSDVWQFDELIKRRGGVDAATRVEELTTAVELYRGELGYAIERANKLTEPYEIWLRPFREQYWTRIIDTHQSLAELVRTSDPERALDVLDRAIRMEPWNQGLYESLISLHLDLGQRHAAERRYRDLVDLLEQLGTTPSAQLAAMMTNSVR